MTTFRPGSEPEIRAKETTGTFVGADGLVLFHRTWRPAPSGGRAGASRGVVVNIHGLGDHSGLYPYLVDHFVGAGWAVHAPDLRGNGRSPGQRAYVKSWNDFRADLDRFLEVVRRDDPGTPIFLVGTSLGGLVVLDYALDKPESLAGVIAASPPVGRLGVPGYLMALAEVASRVWPRLALETGMDLTGLARDPAVAAHVLNDPLFHRVGTARLATEIRRTIARLRAEAGRFVAPVLIVHGGADRMVPPDGSRELVPLLGSRDKEYREYPGAYHALFADYERETVLRDVEEWMNRRTTAAAVPVLSRS